MSTTPQVTLRAGVDGRGNVIVAHLVGEPEALGGEVQPVRWNEVQVRQGGKTLLIFVSESLYGGLSVECERPTSWPGAATRCTRHSAPGS